MKTGKPLFAAALGTLIRDREDSTCSQCCSQSLTSASRMNSSKLQWYRLRSLVGLLLEMNEVSLPLQESNEKHLPLETDSKPMLQAFQLQSVVIMNVTFCYCIRKCVTVLQGYSWLHRAIICQMLHAYLKQNLRYHNVRVSKVYLWDFRAQP